jgi:hypothetical protein
VLDANMGCPFWRIIAIVRALSKNKMRDGGGPELLVESQTAV